MAQMSKCCSCRHYNFKSGECSYYVNSIPKEIFLELTLCDYYSIQKDDDKDADLQIAKGR